MILTYSPILEHELCKNCTAVIQIRETVNWCDRVYQLVRFPSICQLVGRLLRPEHDQMCDAGVLNSLVRNHCPLISDVLD